MKQQSTVFISHKAAIWFGIAGILGSLVLFAGDMLFYYNGDQTDLLANISIAAPDRIIASGVCALFAAWLYTLGAGQLFYAFQPSPKWVRLSVFYAFASVMITYGVVHGAYVAIAASAINAQQLGMQPEALIKLAVDANDALRLFAYPGFAIFTLLFTIWVWKKATHYPRWIILFSPLVPFLLRSLVDGFLEGSIKAIVSGGYLNLMLTLFFSASTIALWKSAPIEPTTRS